jgi:general secretion pathway protein M
MPSLTTERLPTGRTGQALAILLALLLAALVWTVIAEPLLAWHAERADSLERRATLARRMAEVAADLPRLQQQEAEGGSNGKASAPIALFEGNSDAVAAAVLQQKLQDLAAKAGTTLSSTDSIPAQQLGSYRLVGVRVAVNTPWPNLIRFLQLIEEASPQMLVDDLQVRGNTGFIRNGAAPLDTSLVVMGFRTGTAAQ